MPPEKIHRKCPGCRSHLRIEGKLTKPSTIYTPLLAEAMGDLFCGFLSGARHEPDPSLGLESVAVNDLLRSSWKWGRPAHINVLETAAGLTLMNKLAKSSDLRYLHVLDSNVARGALTKGRSSSRSLRVLLLRAAVTQVPGFCLWPDPSKRVGRELKGLSRPRANWLRLGLLLPALPLKKDRTRIQVQLPGSSQGTSRTSSAYSLDALASCRLGDRYNQGPLETELLSWRLARLDPELVSRTLANFGREAFEAGRPYWHFSETINAVASKRPSVRRQLQGAWDVAFGWMALESHSHHVAMPPVILLAMLSSMAGRGGHFCAELGRPSSHRGGPKLNATRACLVLPEDVLFTNKFILLRISFQDGQAPISQS